VVAIGALWLDPDYRPIKLGVVGQHKSEAEVLEDFVRFAEERRPDFVTYNGRGFDLPVIVARCLRHGVSFRHYFNSSDIRYRYSANGHLDLMDYVTDYGATRAVPLNTLAKLIGLPGKVGVDGKDVGPLVHAGRLDEVYAYCLCDVVQTAGLLLRVQLLRGVIDRKGFVEAANALISLMDKDERVRPVLEGTDKTLFLLEK
jgi:predicted PolB exonuclease-like 3'-5' exonuclease